MRAHPDFTFLPHHPFFDMPKMLRLLALLVLFSFPLSAAAQPLAWINELHYDNTGGDVGEFVEVVVEASFGDLSNLEVVRYNGSNGTSYGSTPLTDFSAGASVNGFIVYSFTYPANGLQNGAPDGLALCYNGSVVTSGSTPQFLSYEGTMDATDDCASGLTSTDIGVEQTGSTPVGASVGLQGVGSDYDAFSWTSFSNDSPGTVNDGQSIESLGGNTVQFGSEKTIVMEGGAARIPITINNPSPFSSTTVEVSITNATSLPPHVNIETGTFTFPAGTSGPAYIDVTTHFNTNFGDTRQYVLRLSNVTGGDDAELGFPFQHLLVVQDRFRGDRGPTDPPDDDEPEAQPIADARDLSVGSEVTVEGIVTRARGRLVRIQDETGGIAVFQTSGDFRNAVDAGAVREGDRLLVTGNLTEFRGLLEIEPTDYEVIDRGNPLPATQVVTLAELITNGEAYESELIEIQNMTVVTDDATFQANQNYVVTDASDDSGTISISTFGGADTDIVGAPVPDPATFVGVLGQFDADEPLDGGYQLIPVEATDIRPAAGADGDKITDVADQEQPGTFALHGNYPNPFNPSTTIRFDLPEAATVRVEVYDLSGRQVWATANRAFPAGTTQHLALDLQDLASGVYMYRLLANGATSLHTATGRMILLK